MSAYATWIGLARSLVVYWRPGRQRGLRALYAPFVREGDLVFDVGAHLGDRAVAFAGLGARVIALEPQPTVARLLEWLVRAHPGITVRWEAVGAAPGRATLAVSRRNPTVSTLSRRWRSLVGEEHPGFRGVRWEEGVEVPVVTLDALIAEHGEPAFCKIDVEGYEAEVLAGLSSGVAALSFEFVAGDLERAVRCVRRLEALGHYAFNAVLGEGRSHVHEEWLGPQEMAQWLQAGAAGASSGDVYAQRVDPTGSRAP